MRRIKTFFRTINFFNKLINHKVKIKYFLSLLFILGIFTLLVKITLSFHKNIDRASQKSPQIIKIKEDSTAIKPQDNIVLNNSIIITVEYGKNIFSQFIENGFSMDDARQIINELNLYYDIRKLRPGNKFQIVFDSEFYYEEKVEPIVKVKNNKKDNKKKTKNINLEQNTVDVKNQEIKEKVFEKKEKRKIKNLFFKDTLNSKKIFIKFNEESQKYETIVEDIKLKKELKLEKITVKNSIFADAISVLSSQVIYKILNEFAFSVDFQRDVQKNDQLIVLIEYITDEDGNKTNERILYANLVLNKKNNEIFRFKDNFYNKEGKASSKSLLLSPVDGARISSRFSLNRLHPVLGYSRAHLGIDFAAPVGTPIYAAGDGVITFVGWKGGLGKAISIRHNSEFSTNYGHMSRFNKASKIGTKVKQRTIIGYIGVTGLATGPHLHYELIRNGRKINPRSIKGIASKKLNKQEMESFKQIVLELEDAVKKN